MFLLREKHLIHLDHEALCLLQLPTIDPDLGPLLAAKHVHLSGFPLQVWPWKQSQGPPGNHRWLRWLCFRKWIADKSAILNWREFFGAFSSNFLQVPGIGWLLWSFWSFEGGFLKNKKCDCIHPWNLTWIPTIAMIQRSYLLQSLIFGIRVKFIGCIQSCWPWTVTYRHTKTNLGYTIANSKLCHKTSANKNSLQQRFTRQNLPLATISQNMHLIGNIDTRLPRWQRSWTYMWY